jgi:hypothetical protein
MSLTSRAKGASHRAHQDVTDQAGGRAQPDDPQVAARLAAELRPCLGRSVVPIARLPKGHHVPGLYHSCVDH